MASTGKNERPAKRARADGPDDEQSLTTPKPTNSSILWFKDGSIVLEAEHTRFRVHHTLLALNSPIFEDMLNIGAPRGEDNVDDCPLVILHDSAQDLESLLRALYDRRYFDPEEKQSLSVIASLLRLGKKYEIKHLYDKALKFLTDDYPDTLKGWDARTHRISRHTGFAFDVINLAREFDIHSICPAVFFDCVLHHDAGVILDGIPDPNSSQGHKLSHYDQKLVLFGMTNMLRWSTATAFQWGAEDITTFGECQDKNCRPELKNIFDTFISDVAYFRGLPRWNVHWEYGLCAPCIMRAKQRHNDARTDFWRCLPRQFYGPSIRL
ncbi:hypothetical protein PLICRDRAFT_436297 [Plicaturopsis crispa FD-325 SS-3]|uniref:BTB domain-containing protein n=1 Tax=Plicaturopsis crispa FD-325 SS-3 TaxID=944288 RepID=A0A0C9SKM8_PLICR|nr:hypothetical protein PLICRDRAFT_436297 [Plicaturopsis crispa FD-325 SS-3]